jgi:hypothetical protein
LEHLDGGGDMILIGLGKFLEYRSFSHRDAWLLSWFDEG